MTVKLLRAYGGLSAGALYDGSADDELQLVNSASAVWDVRSAATGGGPGDPGAGGVTNTGGALTSDAVLLGAGGGDIKKVAGITSDGVSKINLGVAGGAVGALQLYNATSGSITLAPDTGALGSTAITVRAASGTMALLSEVGGSFAFEDDSPITSTTRGDGLEGNGYPPTPAFIRSIGVSSAVAATIEAFSGVMPKDGRWNDPRLAEQGIIELDARQYTLERTLSIDLSSASTSRHGLTIRGQGARSTIFYIPATASAANFKGGDGIWRGVRIASSDVVKLHGVRVQGIGLYSYMTQDGDGTTRLADPLRLWDFERLVHSSYDDLTAYSRTLTALSRDQFGFNFYWCFYMSTRNLQVQHFPHSAAGFDIDGTTGSRQCGVGFRFEENNAATHINSKVGQADLGWYCVNENGIAMIGGSFETVNKGFLFDAGSSGCTIHGMRYEYHAIGSDSAMEARDEFYAAKCTETCYDNDVEFYTVSPATVTKSLIDLSQKQSNSMRGSLNRKVQPARNMLGGWTNAAGVTVADSTDLPPGCSGLSASKELTFNGTLNIDRYQFVGNINPDCGSVTFRCWLKRISGDGMIMPMLYANTTRFPAPYQFIDTAFRWGSKTSLLLAASGHSWASTDGGELTLVTYAPHVMQRGMKVTTAAADYGSGANKVPASTVLYVKSYTDTTLTFAWTAGDPNTITSPGALVLGFDAALWQGAPDVTEDWQEFVGSLPIRWPVVGIALNGSDQPVLTFDSSAEVPPTGSIVRLSRFADSRLNAVLHTVAGGDISGAALTISSITAAGMDVSTAAITSEDTTQDSYGWCGHTTIRMSIRCVTNSGTAHVWRIAGEQLLAGAKNLAAIVDPAIAFGTNAVASSTTPALNCALGSVVTFTPTANSTWGAPTNVPPAGETITVKITQDGTGGWTISWNAAYIFPTAWSNTGNTAGKISTIRFVSDGTKLVAQGANSWY